MPDLHALADLGRTSVQALWLPVALWTALAGAVEAGLRLTRSRAALALPVRGAVLAALPLAVSVPAVLDALAPAAAQQLVAWAPGVQWLPGVVAGDVPASPTSTGPAALDVMLGLATLAAALLATVHLALLVRSLAGVAAARRHLAPADVSSQRAVDDARQRLGVARPVAAVVAPDGAAPFTVGWRRPLVALPAGLDDAAREVAALHEVAHVGRADYAWHLAQRAVTAAFAAHPLAWVVGRALDLDRERAADALVLGACPGRRRTYADLLFSYASLPAPALALGAARGSSFLKHRIDAMTSPLSPARSRLLARWGRLGGLLTLALAAGLAVTAAPIPTADHMPDGTADARPAAEPDTTGIYEVAEVQPELIGGMESLQNAVVYPEDARAEGVEGQVIVQFIVNQTGGVQDAVAVRSPDDRLSAAALAAVRQLRFEPGRQDGEPVKVRFAVPVTFRLPAGESQGNARPPVQSLRYAGVDLDRIDETSRRRFLAAMEQIGTQLDEAGRAHGDVELVYTIYNDGQPRNISYLRGDQSLLAKAYSLVEILRTAEDARPGPGGSWTGTFRLWYVGQS